eukprot:GHUV01009313.1.p2 GENE.GHUV01009313.1~~GHUV01009313.1.p2  ORF type:complete len:133 (-),score=5.53 GHUV01009313.1:305-703(-)
MAIYLRVNILQGRQLWDLHINTMSLSGYAATKSSNCSGLVTCNNQKSLEQVPQLVDVGCSVAHHQRRDWWSKPFTYARSRGNVYAATVSCGGPLPYIQASKAPHFLYVSDTTYRKQTPRGPFGGLPAACKRV